MAARARAGPSSRLRSLARRAAEQRQAEQETCDLCGESIPAEHRHVVDVRSRQLLCACRPCSILFDNPAAGGGHFRLLPERRVRIEDFRLTDEAWAGLRIPVEMAFFFHSSDAGRVVAFYPGPMGATESLLELEAWEELRAANPALDEMKPDFEALLIDRARGAREHWIVPLSDCYELTGVIRTRWRGLTGGREVQEEIQRFFERLASRAQTSRHPNQEVPWPST